MTGRLAIGVAARPARSQTDAPEGLIDHLLQDVPADPARLARVRERVLARYRDEFARHRAAQPSLRDESA